MAQDQPGPASTEASSAVSLSPYLALKAELTERNLAILRPASSLRELLATRWIEVARCARFEPLIESFMLLLGRTLRDFAN